MVQKPIQSSSTMATQGLRQASLGSNPPERSEKSDESSSFDIGKFGNTGPVYPFSSSNCISSPYISSARLQVRKTQTATQKALGKGHDTTQEHTRSPPTMATIGVPQAFFGSNSPERSGKSDENGLSDTREVGNAELDPLHYPHRELPGSETQEGRKLIRYDLYCSLLSVLRLELGMSHFCIRIAVKSGHSKQLRRSFPDDYGLIRQIRAPSTNGQIYTGALSSLDRTRTSWKGFQNPSCAIASSMPKISSFLSHLFLVRQGWQAGPRKMHKTSPNS